MNEEVLNNKILIIKMLNKQLEKNLKYANEKLEKGILYKRREILYEDNRIKMGFK